MCFSPQVICGGLFDVGNKADGRASSTNHVHLSKFAKRHLPVHRANSGVALLRGEKKRSKLEILIFVDNSVHILLSEVSREHMFRTMRQV
jgi:hypothetical protein